MLVEEVAASVFVYEDLAGEALAGAVARRVEDAPAGKGVVFIRVVLDDGDDVAGP